MNEIRVAGRDLCVPLCDLCASVVRVFRRKIHHGDAEIAQRYTEKSFVEL